MFAGGYASGKVAAFDSKSLRGESEDVDELEVVRREGMLAAEGDGDMKIVSELAELAWYYCCTEKGSKV